MPMTTAWRNATGDHSLGKSDIGTMIDVFLALFISDPTASGSQTSEVTGTGYARINITGKMSAFAAGVSTNTDEINFGTPGSDWGTVSYIGIITLSSGGVMRYFEQLPNPRTVLSGIRPVKFKAGDLTVQHV